MKESSLMTKVKGKVRSHGLMEDSTLETGRMENNMVKEYILARRV